MGVTQVIDADLTISAGEIKTYDQGDYFLAAALIVGAFEGDIGQTYFEPSVVNRGEMHLGSTQSPAADFIRFDSSLTWSQGTFDNYGLISAIAPKNLNVRALFALDAGPPLMNTGTITAEASLSAIGYEVWEGANIRNAESGTMKTQSGGRSIDLYLPSGGTVINDGTLLAEVSGVNDGALNFACGIDLNTFNMGGSSVTNTGLIEAKDADPTKELAVAIRGQDQSSISITNSGTLRGDYAIDITSNSGNSNPQSAILWNSGTIDGTVELGDGADKVDNSGRMIGDVDLGGGSDIYDGHAGSVVGTVHGDNGNDHLIGGTGNDTFDGGAGADTMTGGAGNDTYYVDNTGDNVIEGSATGGNDIIYSSVSYGLAGRYVETLTLTGTGDINATGNDQINSLYGNSGNNVLDGRGGADIMSGGLGNDTYYIDNAGDQVVEAAGGGFDVVSSSISYTLGANVEGLILTGSAKSGTGNNAGDIIVGDAVANTIDGKGGDDILNGMAGADTMIGGAGNDTFYVDNAQDNVVEADGGGNDTIYSSVSYSLEGRDVETLALTGSASLNATGNGENNILVGNAGNNVLDGGDGNDTVSFATATALVIANLHTGTGSGAGSDRLISIENLTGSAFADHLTGNSLDNVIDGGAGADVMTGGDGDDTYYVNNSADKVVETATGGNDTVYAAASFSLSGTYVETLALIGKGNINATGNGQNNILVGNAGNNVLDGKAGADIMTGGNGDDTYYVDDAGDVVNEASATGGNDTIYSSVSYNLKGRYVETLTLTGSDNTNATGNNSINTLIGNGSANVLDGQGGNDVLTGGGGADIFLFDSALNGNSNVDTITDFSVGTDLIQLDKAIFTALGADGALAASAFGLGTAATTTGQRILYNSATGDIFYDKDGTGSAAAVKFAHVTAGTALPASSFSISG